MASGGLPAAKKPALRPPTYNRLPEGDAEVGLADERPRHAPLLAHGEGLFVGWRGELAVILKTGWPNVVNQLCQFIPQTVMLIFMLRLRE